LIALLIVAITCGPVFWQHTYHQQRFKVLDTCMEVTGTVLHRRHEADGDWHIQLKLDHPLALKDAAEKKAWARNELKQHGCLVIEPVCVGTVRQKDAIAPCRGTPRMVYIPTQGDHVRVSGRYVIDNEGNHGWLEIHAPERFEKIR
jgi:hypothetical protein